MKADPAVVASLNASLDSLLLALNKTDNPKVTHEIEEIQRRTRQLVMKLQ